MREVKLFAYFEHALFPSSSNSANFADRVLSVLGIVSAESLDRLDAMRPAPCFRPQPEPTNGMRSLKSARKSVPFESNRSFENIYGTRRPLPPLNQVLALRLTFTMPPQF